MARPEDMSRKGQAFSHSALGVTGGRLVLKLRLRKHMAPGAILERPCCCGGRDLPGEDLHVPQLLCPVFPVWPSVRELVVVGNSFPPPSSHATPFGI